MVLADLDTSPPPREEIVHIIERAIGAFLTSQEPEAE